MKIKYEPVFGPQELFDGTMDDCEFASEEYGYSFANGRLYYCERYNEKAGWSLSCKSHLTFKPSAMRRIIPEPKRWTVEDHKAGRLPEVGAKYMGRDVILECVLVDKNGDVWGKSDEGLMHCHSSLDIKPIETPEEKAARLRKEWCRKCTSQFYPRGSNGFPETIYDALLSGDLPVPVKDAKNEY